MARITALEQKTFEGKPSGFKITLDDGRSGNLIEKESDKGLRVGDEVAVKEVPYTNKAGKASILYGIRLNSGVAAIPAPASVSTFAPVGGKPILTSSSSRIVEMKFESRMKLIELSNKFVLEGKLTDEEAKTHCHQWVSMADALIDELFTGR